MKKQNDRNGGSNDHKKRIQAEERRRRKEIYEALRNLKPTKPVRFATHAGTHADELWSLDALRQELSKKFPNVDMAKVPVVFQHENVNAPFEGKDGWEHLREGTYVLGCGGAGPFNHHPAADFPGVCTADQVAVFLGFDKKPEYKKLLQRIRSNDLNGGGEYTVISETLKNMRITTPAKLEKALRWFRVHFEPFIAAERELFSAEKKKTLAERGRVWTVTRGREEITVVTVNECNDPDVHKLAAYQYGAEVVICRRTSGNVQIFIFAQKNGGNGHYRRVNLKIAVAINRFNEQKAAGIVESDSYLPHLTKDGFHHGWQYDYKPGWVFNGTRDMPVSPTKVPLARIEEAVALAIQFHPNFNWVPFVNRIRRLPLSETMINMEARLKRLETTHNNRR